MEKQSTSILRTEGTVLTFLLLFLGANAFINAFYGFSLPLFLGTVPLAAGMAFFFPRAGMVAALLLTIFFERFFTLQSFYIGDAAYKLYPLDIILVAVLLATVAKVVSDRHSRFHFHSVDWWLGSFFVFVTGIFLVSAFGLTETSGAVAFSTWKNYVFYGLTGFALVGLLRNKEDLVHFGKLLLFGVVGTTIFLIVGILRGRGLWTEFTPLSTSGARLLAFPHAFYFSLAFVALVLSLPAWWERVGPRQKRLITLLIAFLFLGIISSLMRHLWLGLAGTIALALLFSPALFGRTFTLLSARFIFPVLALLAGWWYLSALMPGSDFSENTGNNVRIVRERLFSIGDSTDESMAWRSAVWDSARERFQRSPLVGIGFGVSVPVELGDYRQYVEIRNMHNSWLALLIQTGYIGMTFFGLFLLTLMGLLWSKRFSSGALVQARFVLTGLLIFQGLVFFSQPYLETNLLGLFFWVTLGTIRALLEFEPREHAPTARQH